MHDCDGEPGHGVRGQVVLDVIVEQPVRDGQVTVEELLPRLGPGAELQAAGVPRFCNKLFLERKWSLICYVVHCLSA